MDASTYREWARDSLSGKWGKAILASLIAAVFGALLVGSNISLNIDIDEDLMRYIPDYIRKYFAITAGIGSILAIVQFIMGGVVQLGYCKFLLKIQDGEEPYIKDLFYEMDRFGTAFLMNLLRSIYVLLWSMLFIIPGIVAAYRYSMAPFILQENPDWSANDAISQSKVIMKGNKGSLFMLDLSFIGWILLSILTLGIGYLWLNPYMNAAHAAFYRSLCFQVNKQSKEQNWNSVTNTSEPREEYFPPRF